MDDDAQYEAGLRPRMLADYIGQQRVRDNLDVSIAAARQRGEALDHVLLSGPPGLGKTTLAYIIGNEMGVPVKATSGPVLERPGDLAAILSQLQPREVLFIDEIHRMNPTIEEFLYPAMEDFTVDVMIGSGAGRAIAQAADRAVHADWRDHTRRTADVAAALALRHRASARFLRRGRPRRRLSRGRPGFWRWRSPPRRRGEIARRSRGTPRIANRLLRRVRDFAQVRADGVITSPVCHDALELLEVDQHGFDEVGSAAAAHDHRQVRRRSGRPEQHRRGDRRREGRDRGRLRAVPDSGRASSIAPRAAAWPRARAYEYFGLTAPGKERLW